MKKVQIKNTYLIIMQILVLLLPAWGIICALRLGYDLAAIAAGFGAVATYIAFMCWVVWGNAGTGPLVIRARRIIAQVLTNTGAVTILAAGLLYTCLEMNSTLRRFDLNKSQRIQLRDYGNALINLGEHLSEQFRALSDSTARLDELAMAMQGKYPRSRWRQINKIIEIRLEASKNLLGLGELLCQIADTDPRSYARRRKENKTVIRILSLGSGTDPLSESNLGVITPPPLPVTVRQTVLLSKSQRQLVTTIFKTSHQPLEEFSQLIKSDQSDFLMILEHAHTVLSSEIEWAFQSGNLSYASRVELTNALQEADRLVSRAKTKEHDVNSAITKMITANKMLLQVLTNGTQQDSEVNDFAAAVENL
ncbi:MAG: hypothetical protein ACYST6_07395 [Planctomycetota bacterium]|jgi:hypothetical protein